MVVDLVDEGHERVDLVAMLGPALLVCPVTAPSTSGPTRFPLIDVPRSRSVYLPEGCDW